MLECTQNGYKEYRAMKELDKVYSNEQLILIAIWRSFHPNEQILGLHQLFLRKLTPTETMSRHNINLVLMTGLVKVSDRYDEPGLFLSIKGGKPYFTAIRSADRKLRIQAASKSEIDSDEQLGKLLDLVFDLLSATIVEYVKFFSDREKLTVLRFDFESFLKTFRCHRLLCCFGALSKTAPKSSDQSNLTKLLIARTDTLNTILQQVRRSNRTPGLS